MLLLLLFTMKDTVLENAVQLVHMKSQCPLLPFAFSGLRQLESLLGGHDEFILALETHLATRLQCPYYSSCIPSQSLRKRQFAIQHLRGILNMGTYQSQPYPSNLFDVCENLDANKPFGKTGL